MRDIEINDTGFLLSFADILALEAKNKTMTGKDLTEHSWPSRLKGDGKEKKPDKQSCIVNDTRGIFLLNLERWKMVNY